MVFSAIKQFNHLNLIFDSISDMVFLISVEKDGSFQYLNANEAALKGSNLPKDFIGKTIHEVMPKQSADEIVKNYQKAMDLKQKVTYEAEIFIYDSNDSGETHQRHFESRITPAFDDKDNCTHIISITHDITERKQKEEEIKQEKTKFELIFNLAADVVFTFDENGIRKNVNKGFTELFGWTQEEITKNPSVSIIPGNYMHDFNDVLTQLKKGVTIKNHCSQRVTKDGDIIDVLSSYSPILEGDKMIGGIAMYKDVTELKRMTEQINDNEQRYRLIFDHLSDIIRVVDPNGAILYASPSHNDVLGITPEFYLNKSILTLVHSEDMAKLQYFLEDIVETKDPGTVEFRQLHKEGKVIWMETRGTPVLDSKGQVEQVILVSRDIGHLKTRVEAYKHQANHDELTNLPNRRFFDEQLDSAISNSRRMKQPIGVFVLDCDHFKHINDSYGHHVGDSVLRIFAERIQQQIHENDVVSRMGGDEFQVLIAETRTKNDMHMVAGKILESIREPFIIDEHVLHLTTSIGISCYEGDSKEKDQILSEADEALYEAKKSGRNTYRTYSSVSKESMFPLKSFKYLFLKKGTN